MLPTISNTAGIKDYFHVRFSQVKIQSVHSLSPADLLVFYLPRTKTLCQSVCPKTYLLLFHFGHRHSYPFMSLEYLGHLSKPCQSFMYQFRFYFCSDTIPSLSHHSQSIPDLNDPLFLSLDPRKWSMLFIFYLFIF